MNKPVAIGVLAAGTLAGAGIGYLNAKEHTKPAAVTAPAAPAPGIQEGGRGHGLPPIKR